MARTRKIKVHAVSIDVDETATHWVVYASPGIELQAQGVRPLRAKMPKCVCDFSRVYRILERGNQGGRCTRCWGRDTASIAVYTARLLKAYPKVTVEIPAPSRPKQAKQQVPEAMRWAGPVRGWVAV